MFSYNNSAATAHSTQALVETDWAYIAKREHRYDVRLLVGGVKEGVAGGLEESVGGGIGFLFFWGFRRVCYYLCHNCTEVTITNEVHQINVLVFRPALIEIVEPVVSSTCPRMLRLKHTS